MLCRTARVSVSSGEGAGGCSRVREGELCPADALLGVGVGSRKEKTLPEGEGSLCGLSVLGSRRGRGEVAGRARRIFGARGVASAARSAGWCCCRVSVT
jgi:hypothetical protein